MRFLVKMNKIIKLVTKPERILRNYEVNQKAFEQIENVIFRYKEIYELLKRDLLRTGGIENEAVQKCLEQLKFVIGLRNQGLDKRILEIREAERYRRQSRQINDGGREE